ncbi:MAG: hypothetical protein ACYDCO_22660 [Armatimonadota bacterium]
MTGVRHLGFDPAWVEETLRGLGFDDLRHGIAHVIDRGEKRYPVFLVSGRNTE